MVKISIFIFVMLIISLSYTLIKLIPDKVTTYKSVGHAPLKLHFFLPENHKTTDSLPVIVFFFGGGWRDGRPLQFYRQSRYLASRGMVAISAEYRVSKKHNTSPKDAVEDAKSAIRWVRNNAKKLGIDPKMIAAGGGSAGGHLAAAAAILNSFNYLGDNESVSAKPNALVLFNPVLDTSQLGYGYERVEKYWENFSPVHNLSSIAPPTVIFHGTKDKVVHVSSVEKYKKEMEKNNLRCDLHLYQGEGHGFFNNSKYNETLLETDRFLISLNYLKGKPTLDKKIQFFGIPVL